VADQLRQNLGINITSYNQEWQSFLTTTRALDYDIARAGWIGDYHDPNTFLDMFVTNGGNNQTGFSSAKYDLFIRVASDVDSQLESSGTLLNASKHPELLESLIERLRSAPNDLERNRARAKLRMAVLAEAESVLVQDEFPIMPIYFYVNTGLVRPEVKGFYSKLTMPDGTVVPNLQDLHPLESIEVSKPGAPADSE
jgi:oligopeptide transport system substrate-binding protein